MSIIDFEKDIQQERDERVSEMQKLHRRLDDIEKTKEVKKVEITTPIWRQHLTSVKNATFLAAGISLVWPQNLVLAGIFLIATAVITTLEATL